ncbi:hypothetical protein [Vallitalea sp.]|jgi:hypothetical protein|uniref:hypothetical protein n=1 Tax=Vallitalea sp. TaxID=1882829 RepID=UPI0025EF9717|nr:hypothetical protein [Vallitalea sp.]MCT4686546.1 hypothetical protein [Vallitalea sp.]
MPTISKIRFTNVIYENGAKRYNDMLFEFDGQNGALLLENGGGKTVFIQTAIQAIIPHIDMANRKIKDTLSLEGGPAHIAIEWILNESPRRYALTATSLFIEKNTLCSLKYAYEYGMKDEHEIESIPFSIEQQNGKKRPSSKGEISEYYHRMNNRYIQAKVFNSISDYGNYIEEHFKIVPSEWRNIALINSSEGDVDKFFNECKTTTSLLNNLLIPVIEKAIEGDQAKGFVDTFEKQREHFKKNKYLQEKIVQSKNVKEEVDNFVIKYKEYDDCLKEYDEKKKKAKTLNKYLQELIVENEENQRKNVERKEKLIIKKDKYRQKDLSYKIIVIDEQLKKETNKLDIEEKQLCKYYEELNKFQSRKQNIEWTKIQEKIKVNTENIDLYRQKLQEYEEDISISELKEQLELNNSNLKGYFENELQMIEKDKQQYDIQHERYETQYTETEAKLNEIKNKEDKIKEDIHRLEAQNEMLDISMEQIANGMLIQLDKENVTENIREWKNRLTSLEEKKLKLIGNKTELNNKIDEQRQLKIKIGEVYYSTKLELEEKKRELKQQKLAEEKLYQELIEQGQYINTHSGIYTKEESILQRLIERQKFLNEIKEKSLLKERLSKRLQDLYENMDIFCAEPVMERIVNSLKNKVGFISLGSNYLQSLINEDNLSKDILFNKFPYWAITIITTAKDKKEVEKKIDSYRKELMYPIFIMTLDDMKKYLVNEDSYYILGENKPILPSIWLDNLSNKEFGKWKLNNEQLAKETENIRKKDEQEYINCTGVLNNAKDFFIQYPYVEISDLEKAISELEQKLINLKENKSNIDINITNANKEINSINNEQEECRQEIQLLEECVTKAIEYNNKSIEKTTKLKSLGSKMKLIETYSNDNKLLKIELDRVRDIIADLLDNIAKLTRKKDVIFDNEIYKDVKMCETIFNNTSREVLSEIRKSLKDKLRGINASRSNIEDDLIRAEKSLEENTRNADYKIQEADFPLKIVDIYYEEEISEIINKIKEINQQVKLFDVKTKKLKETCSKLNWKKEEIINVLKEENKVFYYFNIDINDIPDILQKEKSEINKLENEITRKQQNIELRTKQLITIKNRFDVENAKHNILHETVEVISLEEQVLLDFNYQMKDNMETLCKDLEILQEKCHKKYNIIKYNRETFIEYCNGHIEDSRLRKMAVSGIKNKDDYKELVDYQYRMSKTIVNIIKVAEDDRRQSDIELQTFLTHIHGYLKNVANELNVIQRKTSVKVDGENKQIFIFNIPIWEEAQGKEELRKYIDIIIDEFDRESEKSNADSISIRKLIEKKLSIKNLLNVVMKDKTIKVKCRKVTNDMKITKIPMSWENSNKWSGGEKWSKNMTLFLGLLNYLAEKKQHLSIGQKNNRTVILDNPFGKASSKHVLEPVFFIADKLGFQIIALTAHAQGKFISDYFPIVYSCRLRDAVAIDKQVMTKERHINMAYLKEKSPLSVYRLQEIEQLELL